MVGRTYRSIWYWRRHLGKPAGRRAYQPAESVGHPARLFGDQHLLQGRVVVTAQFGRLVDGK